MAWKKTLRGRRKNHPRSWGNSHSATFDAEAFRGDRPPERAARLRVRVRIQGHPKEASILLVTSRHSAPSLHPRLSAVAASPTAFVSGLDSCSAKTSSLALLAMLNPARPFALARSPLAEASASEKTGVPEVVCIVVGAGSAFRVELNARASCLSRIATRRARRNRQRR